MFALELVGLPGVGKSSISKALAERISAELHLPSVTVQDACLYAYRRQGERLYRLLLSVAPERVARRMYARFESRSVYQQEHDVEFLLDHPGLVGTLFGSDVFKSMPRAERHFTVKNVLQFGGLYHSLHSLQHFEKVVVFDEGFVQASLTTSSPGDLAFDAETCLAFLSHAPKADLIVHLRADVETCVRRLRGRPRGLPRRLRRLDLSQLTESLRLMDQHLSTVVGALSSAGVRSMEYVSERSVDDTVKAVIGGLAPVLATYVSDAREQ